MNRPLGVLALQIDPETYLYPFIKRWPTPSRTGETLLVRRDGNDAMFLNDLKFGTDAALNLRVSLANTNMPAVKAILGQEGVVEGADYRAVPSLAALKSVTDSPWFLVAKMDTAKLCAAARAVAADHPVRGPFADQRGRGHGRALAASAQPVL